MNPVKWFWQVFKQFVITKVFNRGANLTKAKFLGGRFAQGPFLKACLPRANLTKGGFDQLPSVSLPQAECTSYKQGTT